MRENCFLSMVSGLHSDIFFVINKCDRDERPKELDKVKRFVITKLSQYTSHKPEERIFFTSALTQTGTDGLKAALLMKRLQKINDAQ